MRTAGLVFVVGDVRGLWPFLVALVVSLITVTNVFRPSGHHRCEQRGLKVAKISLITLSDTRMAACLL